MTTSANDRPSGTVESDSAKTEEERLNEAVAETSEQAGDKDAEEVDKDLQSAMSARGLDPAETSAMSASIAAAVEEPS